MIGYFIVEGFGSDKDDQGYDTVANVAVKYDMLIKGQLYLPPHLRKKQCDISIGSEIFGVMDDTTGLGCAMYGVDCDITFKNSADYTFTKTLTVNGATTMYDKLTVTKDIQSVSGDVIATSVSLKTHIHPILTMVSTDAAQVVASAASGEAPAIFEEFATTVPM